MNIFEPAAESHKTNCTFHGHLRPILSEIQTSFNKVTKTFTCNYLHLTMLIIEKKATFSPILTINSEAQSVEKVTVSVAPRTGRTGSVQTVVAKQTVPLRRNLFKVAYSVSRKFPCLFVLNFCEILESCISFKFGNNTPLQIWIMSTQISNVLKADMAELVRVQKFCPWISPVFDRKFLCRNHRSHEILFQWLVDRKPP